MLLIQHRYRDALSASAVVATVDLFELGTQSCSRAVDWFDFKCSQISNENIDNIDNNISEYSGVYDSTLMKATMLSLAVGSELGSLPLKHDVQHRLTDLLRSKVAVRS